LCGKDTEKHPIGGLKSVISAQKNDELPIFRDELKGEENKFGHFLARFRVFF
jgi:hypothetical protein